MTEPASSAAPATTFADPSREADYQAASKLLIDPPASQQKIQLLLFSIIAFAAVSFAGNTKQSLVDLAILIGVIFVHELGHVLGMRLFGYRDVRMFFIPFFGAAATGRKRGIARWKEGIVLLLGPMPGIIAGTILAYVGGADLRVLALIAIAVNAINLLPLSQLDGGQLAQLLLFSRHRHLEIFFLTATAGLVLAFAIKYSLWFIVAISVLMLLGVPHRRRILAVAHRMKGMPHDPALLDDAQRRELFLAVWDVVPAQAHQAWRGKPANQAQVMEQVLERATQASPGLGASLGLGLLWVLAFAVAVVGAWELRPRRETDHAASATTADKPRAYGWRVVEHAQPDFTVEMPSEPRYTPDEPDDAGSLSATDGVDRAYVVTWTRADARWLDEQSKAVLAQGRVISDNRINELERMSIVELDRGGAAYTRLLVVGDYGVMLNAVGPMESHGPAALRFVNSFTPK